MPSVFISHSSKDKPFVRQLADVLEAASIKVWLDERAISFGDDILAKIQQGLDYDFVLLILSPDSVTSAWVQQEYGDAFWEQTTNRTVKVLPVLYRDCEIPRLLRTKKYFDLRTDHPAGFAAIRDFLLSK